MISKYRDIAKAFTNEVMTIVDGNFQEALNFIRDMQSCVFLLIEEDKVKKVLEYPLVKAIQRKTYNEVLEMCNINVSHNVDNIDDFDNLLYQYNEGIPTQNIDYLCYLNALDYPMIINELLSADGHINLVMLPNNELMEIPYKYRYKLEV